MGLNWRRAGGAAKVHGHTVCCRQRIAARKSDGGKLAAENVQGKSLEKLVPAAHSLPSTTESALKAKEFASTVGYLPL